MELKFEVSAHVARPVRDVFEAVVDPGQLSSYFTTGGAVGRLESGATVQWDFHDFPGAFPVEVVEVIAPSRIVLRWGATEGGKPAGYRTEVTMTFVPLDGDTRTLVKIAERGWRANQGALDDSYGNCMGWSQMLAALKMWVEHRINLREGMYR